MGCSSSGYHSQQPHHATATVSEISCHKPFQDRDDDDDSKDDSAWEENEWPIDRPLPLPEWGCGRPSLVFTSLQDYKSFLSTVTSCQSRALVLQPYDSVSNFVMFSKEYMASEFTNLQEFYRYYDPPLVSGHYSCVGLAADLASRLAHLEEHYPGFKDAIYPVSCEEELKEEYFKHVISTEQPIPASCVKEHLLLCVRVHIEGRAGVVLLDPGYHLPRPVTVMEDELPPHSGPVHSGTSRSNVTRTFTYHFSPSSSASHVIWEVEENRDGNTKVHRCVIHVSRPFLSGVDVTERYNVLYFFKILLGRDAAGNFTAGLYFPIKLPPSSTTITFFHKVNGEMKHIKKPITYFLPRQAVREERKETEEANQEQTKERSEVKEALKSEEEDGGKRKSEGVVDKEVESAVLAVEDALGRTRGEVRAVLVTMASLLQDKEYVADILQLNRDIEVLRRT